MKKRLAFLLLALSFLTGSIHAQAAEDYIAANHTKSNGRPYYIMVNRAQCTVTVYGLDENGCYTKPERAMVCSVGREGQETPLGTFAITGVKKNWCAMLDGTYGQYSSQFSGYYLFHSICYEKPQPDKLLTYEYNLLGQPASLGCIRLQTEDAKWIFDNCAAGTKVTIYDGADPGPLGKPERRVTEISSEQDNGWDPTDPREENPWKPLLEGPQASLQDLTFLVDGKELPLQSCALETEEGKTLLYVRLRSMGLLLDGTPAQFRVGWDGKQVTVERGLPYEEDGSEWCMPSSGRKSYGEENLKLLVDGLPVTLKAIQLKDTRGRVASYLSLQDLEQLLGFTLGWDDRLGTVIHTGRE